METDAVGYPKREAGDKLVINGYQTIVIENQGLTVDTKLHISKATITYA